MSLLSVDDISVRLDGHQILHDIDFAVSEGAWIGLLGPNGSGKTTLLRAIGALISFDGVIRLGGHSIEELNAQERARRLSYVRQAPTLTFDFTVEELVMLGRAPHRGWLEPYQSTDREQVRRALARVDLEGFASRSALSLSGGELQRVFLAQALVQDTELLLLDEPTSHLDVHYQFSFLEQVQTLVDAGRTVITVFHDLELAARQAERLLVLHRGHLVEDGIPEAVLTAECMSEVFGMKAHIGRRVDGSLQIDYLAPSDQASTDETGDTERRTVSASTNGLRSEGS